MCVFSEVSWPNVACFCYEARDFVNIKTHGETAFLLLILLLISA